MRTVDWKTCLRVAVAAFALYLCIYYWPAVSTALGVIAAATGPLWLGLAIAYVVNLPMAFFERHLFAPELTGLKLAGARAAALLLAVATIAAIVIGVAWLVVPEVVSAVKLLVSTAPQGLSDAVARLQELGMGSNTTAGAVVLELERSILHTLEQVSDTQGLSQVIGLTAGFVGQLVSGVTNALVAFVFALYLLVAKDRLLDHANLLMDQYLPKDWSRRVRHVASCANGCFHGYFVGQTLEACILGVLCALGMLVLQFPYAVMTGAVVGITALVPVAGAYIGGLVGFLMIMTVSPWQAVAFLVYLVVLQQIEGNLIYPKVVGTTLGLPGIWVLGAVIAGAGISGIVGMVLAVPLAATAYKLVAQKVEHDAARASQEAR